MYRPIRSPMAGVVLILLSLVPVSANKPVYAQGARCFPETGQCISGRFREYWEQNGGLSVFGYPISAAQQQQTAEGSFLTQYFERARFEHFPEHSGTSFEVQLGLLGRELLTRWDGQ